MTPPAFRWLRDFMAEWNACESPTQVPSEPSTDPIHAALAELIELEEMRAQVERLKRPVLGLFLRHTPASRVALAEWESRMYEALPAAYRALGRPWVGFPAPRLERPAFRMEVTW